MDLTNIVKLDLEDIDLLASYKWHIAKGYVIRPESIIEARKNNKKHRRRILLSHEIMMRCEGRKPLPHEVVDHINGYKTDNRRSNLRIIGRGQNGINRNVFCKSKTGHRNISFFQNKSGKITYRVKLEPAGQKINEYFDNIEDAIAFAHKKRIELWGDYAHYCIPISRET